MAAVYMLPFCAGSERSAGTSLNFSLTEDASVTPLSQLSLWESLPASCKNASYAILAVAAVLCAFSGIVSVLTFVATRYAEVAAPMTKEDQASTDRMAQYKLSAWTQNVFRAMFAISSLVSGCVLLPVLAVSSYEILSMGESGTITVTKQIACGVFHFVVAFNVYVMLGAVGERLRTMLKIIPSEYLKRVSNPVRELSSKRKLSRTPQPPKKPRCRHAVTLIYLSGAFVLSCAFGLVTLLFSEPRFLFPADVLPEISNSLSVFVATSGSQVRKMAIIYLAFLYVPAGVLIICLILVVIAWLKVSFQAKQMDSYTEAQALLFFSLHSRPSKKGLRSDRISMKRHENVKSLSKRVSLRRQEAGYSHKQEHADQVAANCQENDLCGVITDSIQLQHEGQQQHTRHSTIAPLPPDWLKFSSLKRCDSSASAVKVDDLATTALAVPQDSAASFFGELNETKSTVITFSMIYLLMLPVYVILAVDVYTGHQELLDGMLFLHQQLSFVLTPTYRVASFMTLNLAVCFLLIFVLVGIAQFFMLYLLSDSFRRGALRGIARSSKTKDQRVLSGGNHVTSYSTQSRLEHRAASSSNSPIIGRHLRPQEAFTHRLGDHTNSNMRRSQTERSWRPKERPMSSMHDTHINIDARFTEEI